MNNPGQPERWNVNPGFLFRLWTLRNSFLQVCLLFPVLICISVWRQTRCVYSERH